MYFNCAKIHYIQTFEKRRGVFKKSLDFLKKYMAKVDYIEKFLMENIKNGTYHSDQKIMSENSLANFFSVSRMTARKAILNLISKGYLYQIKGSGTYVANYNSKINYKISNNMGLSDFFLSQNIIIDNKVLHTKHKKANPIIAKKLEISPGTEIFEIERVRYHKNSPIIFEKIFMEKPILLGNNLKIFQNSLNNFLKTKGINILTSIREHSPYIPKDNLKNLFNISENSSLLKTEVIVKDENLKPIYFSEIIYNTNKFKFID
ncbi:regulatory protein, gntR family [Cetobacterium ceti]|uniref:Regulatory protein, gntR family n=2 Tax=Cetobacterium ceti TaxID=180163 RepID=A0A1T4QFN2_9FUSO|nr:regulatory protein, gntR family [Cetobacterium ceti]